MSIAVSDSNVVLSSEQEEALARLKSFLLSNANIFILKGYAGTGKTTLIKSLTDFLQEQNRHFQVMAPTGRAAKILRSKTGSGATIHSCIYNFEDIRFIDSNQSSGKEEYNEHKYIFPIKERIELGSILIVDEASMISCQKSQHPWLQFGSDILLQDLLTYANCAALKTKIIFVGDPAQLPPVGDNTSWAFETKLFSSKGLVCEEFTLREVKRQGDNTILRNASLIRDKIDEEQPRELMLSYDSNSFVHIKTEDVISLFTSENPMPRLGMSAIIAYSNMQCYRYNRAIREVYFPKKETVQVGDVVQIIKNFRGVCNGVELEMYNGDFAQILSVKEEVERIAAPIYLDGIKKIYHLSFREVEMLLDHSDTPFTCLIIDSLLNSSNKQLSYEEYQALYVNFCMRFDEEQKRRKELGQEVYTRKSKQFKKMLLGDRYINAVQCKFGYAITCHKAQGGEWDKAFVDYSNVVSLKKQPLRWCYTATTRARELCYAINPPHFNCFSRFTVSDISIFSKIPKEAYNFDGTTLSPFHNEGQHLCKSHLYWTLIEAIEDSPFELKSILSREYLERYTLSNGSEDFVVEGHHNSGGLFLKGFHLVSGSSDEVLSFFNQDKLLKFELNYNPSANLFKELYSMMQDCCSSLDITITNVEEYLEQYYLIYYLKTDNICSYIQFYFNNQEQLTRAMPRTYQSLEDKKLCQLIELIKEYTN